MKNILIDSIKFIIGVVASLFVANVVWQILSLTFVGHLAVTIEETPTWINCVAFGAFCSTIWNVARYFNVK